MKFGLDQHSGFRQWLVLTKCHCREVIDAVAAYAPVVKPQAAFFEQLGPADERMAGVIQYAKGWFTRAAGRQTW